MGSLRSIKFKVILYDRLLKMRVYLILLVFPGDAPIGAVHEKRVRIANLGREYHSVSHDVRYSCRRLPEFSTWRNSFGKRPHVSLAPT